MKNIYYIGFYDIFYNEKIVRYFPLAAAKKMDFIINTINDIGYGIKIISPVGIIDKTYKSKKITERIFINEKTELILPFSWYCSNIISKCCCLLWIKIWLFFYLILHCNKDDTVLVYHNYANALPIIFAKYIKKFKMILEIEEKFSMIWNIGKYNTWKENLLLNNGFDHSLVVSDVLAKELNIKHPIISYGNYKIYNDIPVQNNPRNNILLVYTGSIDKTKNSAYIAIDTMKFLPSCYNLKITGQISKIEYNDFVKYIKKSNEALGRKAIEYLGILNENDYHQLLYSADIALNPQQEGKYSKYLFPSKILTYMSHGLHVVSTKGESIIHSSISDLISFSEGYSPESFASTILKINTFDKSIYQKRLEKISNIFKKELKDILNKN